MSNHNQQALHSWERRGQTVQALCKVKPKFSNHSHILLYTMLMLMKPDEPQSERTSAPPKLCSDFLNPYFNLGQSWPGLVQIPTAGIGANVSELKHPITDAVSSRFQSQFDVK